MIVLLFGLSYCAPPKYFAERETNIAKLEMDNNLYNFIPLTDSDLKNSSVLDSTYRLIIKRKYSFLKKYLNSLEKSGIQSSDLNLCKALHDISRRDYLLARQNIERIKNGDFTLLKRLLTIDLDYEILRINKITNYNKSLKDYQDLIDAYPDNPTLKKIVALRLRYIRYNN